MKALEEHLSMSEGKNSGHLGLSNEQMPVSLLEWRIFFIPSDAVDT